MSKSNWSGGSGWGAINDPTGLLTGRVLVTTAGQSQYAEDYLFTLAGTTTNFTDVHYAVTLNYAFPTYVSATTFNGASLGIVSRASALTTTAPTTAESCYIGRISPKDGVAEIVRRVSGVDTVLASSTLSNDTYTYGVLHTMRLNTFGTNPVTIQFIVDDEVLVNAGDSSVSALVTGYAGIQMQGGTAYVDNFTIFQYTSSGTGAYTGLYPNSFYDTASGLTSTFLILWLRGDVGLTKTGDFVDSWADSSQTRLGSSYSLTQTGSNRPESPTSATLNSLAYVRFDRSKNNFLQGAINSGFDIFNSGFNLGVGMFAVIRFWENNGIVGDGRSVSLPDDTVAPLGNYGRGYQFEAVNSILSSTTHDRDGRFFNNSAAQVAGPAFVMQNWGILEIISFGSGSNVAGVYFNGSLVSTVSSDRPLNFDLSDPALLFMLGRRVFSETAPDYLYGSFDLAEYLLVQVGSGGMTDTIRQKTEGYLAWKWNLEALLPSSHPFKTSPPT